MARSINAAARPNTDFEQMGLAGPGHPGAAQAGEVLTFLVALEALFKPGSFLRNPSLAKLTPGVVNSIQNYAEVAKVAADCVGRKGVSAAIDLERSLAGAKAVLKTMGGAVVVWVY